MEQAACWPAVADAPPKDCKVFPPAAMVTAPAPDWITMTLYPAGISVAGRVMVIAVAEVELIMVPASTAAKVKLAALSTIVARSGLIGPVTDNPANVGASVWPTPMALRICSFSAVVGSVPVGMSPRSIAIKLVILDWGAVVDQTDAIVLYLRAKFKRGDTRLQAGCTTAEAAQIQHQVGE